jgi:tRNA uridine 5-carboxymethylaminomethyl modification enzyme
MSQRFDVIIIGGGHAGIEAAHAAAQLGSSTLLITIDRAKIGLMPCNPSIGGLGKGHIVFEISALGGLMPKLCSNTYLSARMLNTSKGPAVQGLRLQIDKYAYNTLASTVLQSMHNLTIIDGMVDGILMTEENDSKKVTGVTLHDGRVFCATAVVVTTGTFLDGRVHIGFSNHSAGRHGEKAAIGLSDSLQKIMGITVGRLKTGTPPRLLRSSINFAKLAAQPPMPLDHLFEFEPCTVVEKIPCYITQTNPTTHKIIAENLHQSAMYSGNIKGVGPRYCPSIEDKIGRFADRTAHHVFIEPEGGDNSEVYPAGLSTSLPVKIQHDYIHSIEGFENAIITKPGYAVEYDFIQPTHLTHALESKSVRGLFCAGQVNGTTGYEEAAGQGIIAGINAHRTSKGLEHFVLNRNESYIGIMIDDLVTLGVDEPYRMFTSRAERRLILRQDNVFKRLMPYARKLGMINEAQYARFVQEQAVVDACVTRIQAQRASGGKLFRLFNSVELTEDIRTACRAELALLFAGTHVDTSLISSRALLQIHAEIRYDGYIAREEREAEKATKFQELIIPETMDFDKLPGLTGELQQKLKRFKPNTIAQAQLIPGMTPAAISLLIFKIREREKNNNI